MARRRNDPIFWDKPHRGRSFLLGLLVVALLLFFAVTVWNFALNHTVGYERLAITLTTLPNDLEGFTILHLSDLNGETLGSHQSAIFQAINGKSFSCIVMSGNMVGKDGDVGPLLDLVAGLPKDTPKLLIPGDSDPPLIDTGAHGSVSPYADWAVLVQEAGVTILDEPLSFTRGKATIWFTPEYLYTLNVDNTQAAYQNVVDTLNAQVGSLTADQAAQKRAAEYNVQRMQHLREAMAAMKSSDIQVAVTNYPLTREEVQGVRNSVSAKQVFSYHHVSLVLAGGYCNGQWRLPGIGAVYVPEHGWFPGDVALSGLHYLDGVWQHISPGLGASPDYPLMPFRLFNSPGVTVLVLTTSL